MASGYGPPAPAGYGAQPCVPLPSPSQQAYPVASAAQIPQPCYNCGSRQHIAQFCTEPRRAVPVGAMSQKPRPAKTHSNAQSKKNSKPVITRYAPPPGYVPPSAPPHGRPSVNTAMAAPYAQAAHYGPQSYSQTSSPATPQWQNSPQAYGTPQWQSPTTGTPTSYGPYQQPQSANPAYGHSPITPYTHQQSPVQQSPGHGFAPKYPTSQPPAAGYYSAQPVQAHAPQAGFGLPAPATPATPYTQAPVQNTYQAPFPQQAAPITYPTYSQSAQTPQPSYPPYQPPRSSPVALASSSAPHFAAPYAQAGPTHGNRNNHNNRNNRNRDGRNKRFQATTPVEKPEVRPPSPPRIFTHPLSSSTKTKAGASIWKPPQPVIKPIANMYDPAEEVSFTTAIAPVSQEEKKNVSGTKYYDDEGKAISVKTEDDDDPVWSSVRIGGSARANIEGIVVDMDQEMEAAMKELLKTMSSDQTQQNHSFLGSKNTGPTSVESKKRSYDEFTSKQSNDQDRRPNKRRQQDRNRRGNRSGRGGAGNKQFNRNSVPGSSSGGQNPPAQRHYHPLPPKPIAGPLPAQSSLVDNAGIASNATVKQENPDRANGSATSPQPRVNDRRPRSASPTREGKQASKSDSSWRQRDYDSTSDQKEQPGKLSDNADVRRHGSAAMEVYSRRW